MRKTLSLVLLFTVFCMGILTGCEKKDISESNKTNSGTTDTTSGQQETAGASEQLGVKDTGKTLILYFSYSGNTEQIAEWVQEYTGAEMIRLEAADPYPEDYDACVERAEAEHHEQARPELKTDLSVISDYDTSILGWPCWNYSCPMLIRTMLEQYDFSGKTIIPFTTSDVSGFSGSLKEMKESSQDAIFEEKGMEVRAKDVNGAQDTVEGWLSSLGFAEKKSVGNEMTDAPNDRAILKTDDLAATATEPESEESSIWETEENTMKVIINGNEYSAKLDSGRAAQELKNMLPFTLTMQELNGNEKYGDLSDPLTQEVYSPGQIHAGDILLWGSDTLVVFYKDFPTQYSYTKVGRIDDPEGLSDTVGKGCVEVIFQ